MGPGEGTMVTPVLVSLLVATVFDTVSCGVRLDNGLTTRPYNPHLTGLGGALRHFFGLGPPGFPEGGPGWAHGPKLGPWGWDCLGPAWID